MNDLPSTGPPRIDRLPTAPPPPAGALRTLVRIAAGWLSALLMENVAGAIIFGLYAFATGQGPRLLEVKDPMQLLDGDTLVVMTALAAPALWLWLWFYRRRVDLRDFRSLGLGGRGRTRQFIVGWLLGALVPGLVLAAGLLLGSYQLGETTHAGAAHGSLWIWLPVLLISFAVQGSSEELLMRGYFQRSLLEWRGRDPHRATWALLIPSFVFSLSHGSNAGYGPLPFVNTVLIGVVLGCLAMQSGALWSAFGAHAGWNLGLSAIWSLPVSGVETAHLLGVTRVKPDDPLGRILWGGEYGPEGGAVVTILVVAILAVLVPRTLANDEARLHGA